jgi:hypothetical protein
MVLFRWLQLLVWSASTLLVLGLGFAMLFAGTTRTAWLLLPSGFLCLVGAWRLGQGLIAGFKERKAAESVTFDEEGVTRRLPGAQSEVIRWSELAEVRLITTSAGPLSEDVFLLLANEENSRGCVVSHGSEGFAPLLTQLQQLAEFRDDELSRAMRSTSENQFVLWRREDVAGRDAAAAG